MKRLLLLRHAKSDWNSGSISDFERPLNARGLESAPLMGAFIHDLHLNIDRIISSPAQRTKQTADIIAHALDHENIDFINSLYESSTQNLFNVISATPQNVTTLLVIGHNPSLGELAYVLDNFEKNLPTAGLLEFELTLNQWSELQPSNARLVRFEYPKNLKT